MNRKTEEVMDEKKEDDIMQWIIGIAASAAVTVILLITSFEAAMYLDFSYYQKEYEKYHVLEDLDMKMEDVMYVTEEMMAYLRGDRKELKVITTVEGKRIVFFNEQDRFHMEEVQGLFLGGIRIQEVCRCSLGCMCLILLRRKENPVSNLVRRAGISYLVYFWRWLH